MSNLRAVHLLAGACLALSACDELFFPEPEPEPEPAAKTQPAVKANEGLLSEPEASHIEVCADDGLLLARHEISVLKHRFAEICCGPDGLDPASDRCTQPWPAPAPMSCDRWLELHTHLLARYGHGFQREEVQAHYDAQPWYKRNEAFRTGQLSITAKRNVAALEHFRREKIGCE